MSQPESQQSSGHRARKRFGQNFLVNSRIISDIIRIISPQSKDNVLEIGPGLGALTNPLLLTEAKITCVELDKDLASRLSEQHDENPNFKILIQDALHLKLPSLGLSDQSLRIVGNLPYNISTPLIFHLLRQMDIIKDMYFMLQKELVDRLTANPNSKEYGRLSVMVQYQCRTESLLDVPPDSFDPQPKVQSAIVRIQPKKPELELTCYNTFSHLVRDAFNQRRKTLRNALKAHLTHEQMSEVDVISSKRAENLTVTEFVKLSNCAVKNKETA